MVDEAHGYKNLAIFPKMNNVSCISSSGAKKSTDMQLSTSPVGNKVKLENTFNGLSEHEEFLFKEIDQYQRDMEQSKKEYEKPFVHETELKEKLVRQFELNAQLDLENGKVEDVDLNGTKERDEDVEDSHVAEWNNEYRTRRESDIR